MKVSYENFKDKKINELVFAGSHDAGINSGSGNEQTQKLDIFGQAAAGVRIFDLRVAVHSSGLPGSGVLQAYHGPGMHKVLGGNQLMAGTWGLGLEGMLADARRFVARYHSEFLFLKFDHCKNWNSIAKMCVESLGPQIYMGTGNLNNKQAKDFSGKVVVLFSNSGLQAIDNQYKNGNGILGVKSLYKKGEAQSTYDPNYNGIQYHGKGGTSAMNGRSNAKKLKENIKKQRAIMDFGIQGNPEVMGMMYWTTTGFLANIRKRDNYNWRHSKEMIGLWKHHLSPYLNDVSPSHLDLKKYSSGNTMKTFMPNFVMIDFADPIKCQTIFDLNNKPATELVDTYKAFAEEKEDETEEK